MCLIYYANLNDAPVTDLLRQANINTKNQLMDFSGSSWQDFSGTGKSTGATRVDLSFSVQNLAKFSANPGKVHFEELVHLLRYIKENKTLGLK